MTDDRTRDPVARVLRLLADRLESFAEGDDLALETLAESLEESDISTDDLQAAILALRGMAGNLTGYPMRAIDGAPGHAALRILSHEERESLSTEAWGYLIELRSRGSLDPGQFERVLDVLTGSGVRPVGVELAREVATRVALQFEDDEGAGDFPYGDVELNH